MSSDFNALEFFEQPAMRRLLIPGSLLMLAVFFWYTATRASLVTHGFAVYYTNARMLLEGEDFQRAYESEYFNSKIKEYGIHGIQDVPHNLPTNALLLAPISWMTPEHAKVVLSAASFGAIILSLLSLLRLYGVRIRDNLGMGLAILFLGWRPIYDNIYLGQVYALLLLLFCLSLQGIKKARSLQTTIPLSLAFLFKGHGVVAFVWLLLKKRWKAFLLACLMIVLVVLGTLPFFGIESWTSYYLKIVSTLGTNPTDAAAAYQTMNSLIFHLFTYDPQWLPQPLVLLPGYVVRLISYAANIALILVVLVSGRRVTNAATPISFSAAIALGVVTAPLAEEYAFTLFLPLVVGMIVAIAANLRRTHSLRLLEWTCLAAILILTLPLHYEDLPYASFPLVLLAYPKLFAGMTLLLCFARMATAGYFEQDLQKGSTISTSNGSGVGNARLGGNSTS